MPPTPSTRGRAGDRTCATNARNHQLHPRRALEGGTAVSERSVTAAKWGALIAVFDERCAATVARLLQMSMRRGHRGSRPAAVPVSETWASAGAEAQRRLYSCTLVDPSTARQHPQDGMIDASSRRTCSALRRAQARRATTGVPGVSRRFACHASARRPFCPRLLGPDANYLCGTGVSSCISMCRCASWRRAARAARDRHLDGLLA